MMGVIQSDKAAAPIGPYSQAIRAGGFVFVAGEKGLELCCDVAVDLPQRVIGDAQRLRQILVNLLGNAVKFTEQGWVAIAVAQADGERGEDAVVTFTVTDTGIGIPAHKHSAVFEDFEQADGSTTRKYGGTGLGLPIAARLVRLMGGELTLESAPGKGTVFRFAARLPAGTTPGDALPAPTAPDAGGRRALVVDPVPPSRDFLARALLGWGFRVTTAESAPAARECAEKTRFAVAVIAHVVGKTSGVALARLLREANAGHEPVIVLTGSVHDRVRTAPAAESNVDLRLAKPFRLEEVRETLREALGGRASDGPTRRETRPKPPAVEAVEQRRILLVEDNPVNQQVATLMLERHGHQVVQANNGREALAVLENDRFDLILMDVQMPDMDGLEATRRIRQRENAGGQPRVPIVALTAHAFETDRDQCRAAGMDGYVSKPFATEQLLEGIRAHLA